MQDGNLSTTQYPICLDKECSTTRMLTLQKPFIKNKPGDSFETVLFLPEGQGRKGEGGLRTKGYFKKSWHAPQDSQLTPHDHKPLITVITVVLNCESHLEKTIQSILNQTYDNLEYIIIDGGSTDGTLDIIKKYEDKIDYWISEKDDGLYDAMNKGITLATGDIIGLVNADDCLYPSTVDEVAKLADINPVIAYTYGEVDLMCPKGIIFGRSIPLSRELAMKRLYREMPYRHISIFVARQVYKTLGRFDTSFEISADYDFLIRMIKSGCPALKVPKTVGAIRIGGVSSHLNLHLDTRKVLHKHGVPVWERGLYFMDSWIKTASYIILPRKLIMFLRRFRTSMNTYHPDS